MKNNIETNFMAGMYLLETLTAGMYNEPLSIFREYIQNSVDSIDFGIDNKQNISKKVDIQLDPFNKKIQINDKGFGVSSTIAAKILSSIGSSPKVHSRYRGFRGIGRLGGIAFSDKAVFRTKADGEVIESIQEWDCIKLRQILSETSNKEMPIDQLFNEVTNFDQVNGKPKNGSYFNVELEGVNSFRNYLFDINRVQIYLSQIAPVPFSPESFSFADDINNYLQANLKNYGIYEITLNGEPVFKPYRDLIKITKMGHDKISNIKKVVININGEPFAYGWYGLREDLLGAISRGEYSSGIRVRSGNILIGDSHLLDGCFREPRFNSYVVGEIHIDNPKLIPNGRRDDFVDNESKTLFYNAIEKDIGHIISKKIREKSRIISDKKQLNPLIKNDDQVFELFETDSQIDTIDSNNDIKDNNNIIENKAMGIISVCKNCKNYKDIIKEIKTILIS